MVPFLHRTKTIDKAITIGIIAKISFVIRYIDKLIDAVHLAY